MYKEMYLTLFKAVTKIIIELQEVQKKCEEIYIEMEEQEKKE